MPGGSSCAQATLAWGVRCAAQGSWELKRRRRETPGEDEDRGEEPAKGRGRVKREAAGAPGGAAEGQAQQLPVQGTGSRPPLPPGPPGAGSLPALLSEAPTGLESQPPPTHRANPLPGAGRGPGLSAGAPWCRASLGPDAVHLLLFVPGDLSAPAPHGPMNKRA